LFVAAVIATEDQRIRMSRLVVIMDRTNKEHYRIVNWAQAKNRAPAVI